MDKKYSTFEDNIHIINEELKKRKGLWNLSSIQYMDYDDVCQIIRIHIYEKWHLYDQSKPLIPWLNITISHQIKNLVRNLYTNYSRPCLKCEASIDEGCKIYTEQCARCPLYAAWEKGRKKAYAVKIPIPLEPHLNNDDIEHQQDISDIEKTANIIHEKMKSCLKPNDWLIYQLLFIEQLSDEEVALKLGYKLEEDRAAIRNKQIKNIRKKLIAKVKKIIANDEVDI